MTLTLVGDALSQVAQHRDTDKLCKPEEIELTNLKRLNSRSNG